MFDMLQKNPQSLSMQMIERELDYLSDHVFNRLEQIRLEKTDKETQTQNLEVDIGKTKRKKKPKRNTY